MVPVFIVHSIRCIGFTFFVGHARRQHVLLEASVLNQFSVKAAVAGMADFLEENTIEIR